ncbi:hypothetical protein B0H10DRAFT_2191915 [Mycena sp. CBHHK59/15]|nr:hypothetical protein B0H10DRAFT_2191915 [Mycena sp. CBHHK59/15]
MQTSDHSSLWRLVQWRLGGGHKKWLAPTPRIASDQATRASFPYKCGTPGCNQKFAQPEHLRQHTENSHLKKSPSKPLPKQTQAARPPSPEFHTPVFSLGSPPPPLTPSPTFAFVTPPATETVLPVPPKVPHKTPAFKHTPATSGALQPPVFVATPAHPPNPPNPTPVRFQYTRDMPELTTFTGDRKRDTVSPPDFQQARNYFRAARDHRDHFKDKSLADKWFKALDPVGPELASFAAFSVAFEARFQGVQEVVKPQAQLEAELSRMRITLQDLGVEYMTIRDKTVYTIVNFANRVEDAASAADAGKKTIGLWEFVQNLPPVIQDSISVMPADWDTAASEISKFSQTKIAAAVKAYLVQTALQDKMAHLSYKLEHGLRISPPRASNINHTPVSTNRTPPPAAPPAGNGPCAKKIPTEADKRVLRNVIVNTIVKMSADTSEGQAAYLANIASWNVRFANIPTGRLALETIGYPLHPGSSAPCMADCYKCGMATSPPHIRPHCTGSPAPALEQRYRSVCGEWLGPRSAIPVPVNAVTPWWEDVGSAAAVVDEEEVLRRERRAHVVIGGAATSRVREEREEDEDVPDNEAAELSGKMQQERGQKSQRETYTGDRESSPRGVINPATAHSVALTLGMAAGEPLAGTMEIFVHHT